MLTGAACTEDDDDEATDTTESSEETTTTPDSATPTSTDEATGDCPAAPEESGIPAPTGPADEAAEPVRIGFVNIDTGQLSFPGSSTGIDAGAAYINACLGGIGGAPVEIIHCDGGLAAETTQACAQEFANDDSVQVLGGGFVIVSDPLYPILEAAGKTINLSTPLNPPDFSSPAAVSFFPGNPGISAGLPIFAIDFLDAQEIAVVVSDNDAGQSALGLVEAVTANDDVTITPVSVADTEVDYTGPITAAGAQDADVFIPLVAQPGCIQVANALDALALDVPVISTQLCADPQVAEETGGKNVGWYFGTNGPPTQLAEGSDPEVDFFQEAWAIYGEGDANIVGTGAGFGQALTFWSVGNEIGADADAAAWDAGMREFTGPVFLGPREVACGSSPLGPNLCAAQSRVFQLTEEGLVDATDGQPIDPGNRG